MTTNKNNESALERYSLPLDASDAEEVGQFQEATTQQRTMRLVVTTGGLSIPMSKPPAPAPESSAAHAESDEQKFRRLASQWRKETRWTSSLSKMALNPNYQKIIGMGEKAVPLILRDLRDNGGHWLWALFAIMDYDPAPENATFGEAKAAWLEWGKDYLK